MRLSEQRSSHWINAGLLLVLVGLLAACQTSNYYKDDRPPAQSRDLSKIPDAVPKVEPITKAGNKNPYTVLGRTYRLLPDNNGYKERGIASWYGTKFHGNKTANGETYDMFAMTAAHKTLHIPAYVKVTNLDNGKQVVVRVNDRGPFLHDRLIDLSYAAAQKLGYADQGIARVEVEYIDPRPQVVQPKAPATSPTKPLAKGPYLQLAAFSTSKAALQMQAKVRKYTGHPVLMMINEGSKGLLYKVLIGPLKDQAERKRVAEQVKKREKLSPFLVHF